jgi:hypothetical protein
VPVAHKIQAAAILYLVLLPQLAAVMAGTQVLAALVEVAAAAHLMLQMLVELALQVKVLQVAQELRAQEITQLVAVAVPVLLVLQALKMQLLVVVEQELAHQLLAHEYFTLVAVAELVKALEQHLLD